MFLALVTRRMEVVTAVKNSSGGADLRQVDQQLNFRHVVLRSGLAIQLFVSNQSYKERNLGSRT